MKKGGKKCTMPVKVKERGYKVDRKKYIAAS
jgi:hypothetical protein